MSLSSFAVKAPVKITMIFFAVLLLGWISLDRLPTNLFPDIQAPKVTVTVRTTGLSPAEVERRICEVIERSLYSVRGVVRVETLARADSAVVIVNFDWNTDLDFAFLEVKKAASDLQRTRSDDIESVNVLRYDPNALPIMTVALEGGPDTDLESLYRTADQSLRPRFERLEGVANVVLTGGEEREILVELDEPVLLNYQMDVQTVVNAIRADNADATGGWVEEGSRRYLLKTVGEYRDIDEVSRVVVSRLGERSVLLSDVATIRYAPREPKSIVYWNGTPAVGIAFYREAEGNTVAVARSVREELAIAEEILPEGWRLHVANDQSLFISAAIREVRNNALIGGLLAIMVLLLFLRDFRTTMIVAVAIPVSIIATFNLMYFQGLSLNLMSLGGLALGCGMLVDNAIVVLENIFRKRQEGVDAKESAIVGTREVSGALVASTLTTVAVFLPIIYVQGIAGLFFKEQALTVTYSLLASLFVALLLIPMLAAYFLKGGGKRDHRESSLTVPTGVYPWILRRALRLRWIVLLVAAGALYMSYLVLRDIPREFLPPTDERQVTLRLVLPNGTPIEGTDRVVETVLAQINRYDAAVEHVFARVGEPEGVVNANTEDPDGPNTADFLITLKTSDQPTTAMIEAGLVGFSSIDLAAGLKPVLDRIEGATAEFRTGQGSLAELLGTTSAPLVVEFSGPELETLTILAGEASRRLSLVDGLVNVRTNLLEGAPEILLRLDRTQLARHGLDVNSVANTLRRRIDGELATQVRREAGEMDIRVRMKYEEESLETVRNITFRSPSGALVRLDAIAEFEVVRGPREIARRRQERVARVLADLDSEVRLSQAIELAQEAMAGLSIPARYTVSFTGEEEQRRAAFGDLAFALILSIALVYMVMASIFESFIQPFLILFTIPLAGVGVVVGLVMAGQTLNVMSIIGIVMLGGIVVNNAIVLLDCVNQVRGDVRSAEDDKLTDEDTLIIGCTRRFRPVLMTTATTLLGLLPMALGFGEGAQLRQAMAITVLGGLASSTLLTLLVIPCAQRELDKWAGHVRRLTRRLVGSRGDSLSKQSIDTAGV
ncbi:MAG: efflux RND transporter permease subunit [Candidatus Sumerlaeia bacterium]|nr:efflux RND transporter permease subunit [Candidatus Sumerlaeia bacterium]